MTNYVNKLEALVDDLHKQHDELVKVVHSVQKSTFNNFRSSSNFNSFNDYCRLFETASNTNKLIYDFYFK